MNYYFLTPGREPLSVETITGMIEDAGFSLPSQEILEHCAKTVAPYYTFTWDSPRIERLCFCIYAQQASDVPTHWHPIMERYVAGARFAGEQQSFFYNITMARTGDYVKIENDYTGTVGYVFGRAAQA